MQYEFHDPTIAKMVKVAYGLGATAALTYLPASVAAIQLGNITTTGLYLSIHSGSPGTTGLNEIVGSTIIGYSTGGYTGQRMAITWAGASGGVVVSSNTQTFPLLATQAGGIGYFGIWTDTGATAHAG